MEEKLTREKRTVFRMIKIFCNSKHNSSDTLCEECRELLAYAHVRLDKCRYNHNKPACESCSTHCYNQKMRDHIREVMRFSGPRMIFYHPKDALVHIFQKLRTNNEK